MSQETYDFILDHLSAHGAATARDLAAAQSEGADGSEGQPEAVEQIVLDLQTLASFGHVHTVGEDGTGAARWDLVPGFRRADDVPGQDYTAR